MTKKYLALAMASVMAVSAGSTVFAWTNLEGNASGSTPAWTSGTQRFVSTAVELTVDGVTYTRSFSKDVPMSSTSDLQSVFASALSGMTFRNVEVNRKLYTAKLTANGSNIKVTLSPSFGTGVNSSFSVRVLGQRYLTNGDLDSSSSSHVDWSGTLNGGKDETYADATIENLSGLNLQDIIVCDGEGNPVALTEKDSSAEDGDRNGEDGVRSGKTLYFMIRDGAYKFGDDTYWKLRVSKGKNGKYIKKISDVSKNFSSSLYNVGGGQASTLGSGRQRYIKVELNELYTDDEYKITLDLRLTPKQKAVDVFGIDDGAQVKVNDFSFWVKNTVRNADSEWRVGVGGLMLSPLENDWNEVTYYNEDGDVAFMKFFADSDVDKFYAKLSTKWEHADYASYFNDQDAYLFDFTGTPKISATSRCDLQIYNPFVDDDGSETIDPASAVIYQVIDGDLYDVTDSFTYEEGDNGDMAYTTRTRFMGIYVICEKPVEEAR